MIKRKSANIILIITLLAFFLSAAAPYSWEVRLSVYNSTHGNVFVLLDGKHGYYLTVHPRTSKNFTIQTGIYKITVWGCGSKKVFKSKIIDRQMRLTVPVCKSKKHNTEKNVLRVVFTKK